MEIASWLAFNFLFIERKSQWRQFRLGLELFLSCHVMIGLSSTKLKNKFDMMFLFKH